MKKAITMVLVVVMILGLSIHLFAFSDADAPVLVSVQTNVATGTNAGPGDTITLTITVDDASGLSYARAIITNGSNVRIDNDDMQLSGNTATMSFTLSEYQTAGTYYVRMIDVEDRANNRVRYSIDEPNSIFLEESMRATFSVVNASSDSTPPTVVSVEAVPDTVSAPGSVTVSVSASDDLSGVQRVWISFLNDTQQNVYGDLTYDGGTGKWSHTFALQDYHAAGVYSLRSVEMWDNANNHIVYEANVQGGNPQHQPLPVSCSFTVSNQNGDITPPQITSLTATTDPIEVPGFVTLTANITDDISGYDRGIFGFRGTNGNEILIWIDKYDFVSGSTYVHTESLGPYQADGVYTLYRLHVIDAMNNIIAYGEGSNNALPFTCSFSVENTNVGVSGNMSDTDLLSKINGYVQSPSSDGGSIGIAYTNGSALLSADILNAVAGTTNDVDLVLTGNVVQWIFNSQTLDPAKIPDQGIFLHAGVSTLDEFQNSLGTQLETGTTAREAFVLNFPPNGELPGPATIRLKVDYVFQHFTNAGSLSDICLYYYNPVTGLLEEKATGLRIIDNTFVEFTLTHNSSFVMTSGRLDLGKKNDPPPTTSGDGDWVTIIGGSASGSSSGSSTDSSKRNPGMGQ